MSKFKARTRWREKLERVPSAKRVQIPPKMQKRFGKGTMLVPKPLDVDALIRTVPRGQLVTQGQIRDRLAKAHKTDTTCPMTTGILIRIVAETAEEDLRNGRKRITPYWRVLKEDGSLNVKFPGGVEAQAEKLKQEGHTVERGKGRKPPRVVEHEGRLAKLG
ncbi:MAG TPA: hypothetical protein VJH03_02780 [Blastocatellia bacterium]|nr:hypothetical protein [Blastocatellia bacterium]